MARTARNQSNTLSDEESAPTRKFSILDLSAVAPKLEYNARGSNSGSAGQWEPKDFAGATETTENCALDPCCVRPTAFDGPYHASCAQRQGTRENVPSLAKRGDFRQAARAPSKRGDDLSRNGFVEAQ
jgi:hypothetical protein